MFTMKEIEKRTLLAIITQSVGFCFIWRSLDINKSIKNKKTDDAGMCTTRHIRIQYSSLELLEEVVALVINEDECREVFNMNLPDRFHAEFWIFNTLDALDVRA